ncbi:MAG: hypothetical protein OXH52_14685 [Gammaproteobacteria bacterium]|nr:hypothetical protein [Gammaproteobacteria bacterium]
MVDLDGLCSPRPLTKEARSKVIRRIHRRNTKPELALRRN